MINDSTDKDNNDDDGLLTSQKALRRLLDDTLPRQEEIVYAFGYGSGVLAQEQTNGNSRSNNKSDNDKMVDLILVVRDSFEFHKANYQANPSHYWIPPSPVLLFMASSSISNKSSSSSSSSWSSPSSSAIAQWCTWWQRHEAPSSLFQQNKQSTSSWLQNPGVYYNIVDNDDNQQPSLKYGVVQVDDLVDDLKHWKYLYLAGRMHKPIVTILSHRQDASFLSISQAQQDNLMAALSTSLLLLSKSSSSSSSVTSAGSSCNNIPSAMIFRQVAALSYAGDFRMSYAEDPKKIDKLVQGGSSAPGRQLQRFESLYHHAASQLVQSGVLSIDKSSSSSNSSSSSILWSWDASSPAARQLLWSKLPPRLQQQQHDSATARANHHHDYDYEWLSQQLALIVAPAARYQSFKGIVTAGPRKAWVYAARKISKRFWLK